jgi:hypothetical protein
MRLNRRLGFLSSLGLLLTGIAYAIALTVGVAQAGLSHPIVDPILAVMEVITLLAALLFVVLMVAIYGYASEDRKPLALIALAFGAAMAGLTSGVHFAALTWGRQTGFTVLEWPSMLYAVDLLAWDVFLGLSLLFAAPVFVGPGLHSRARWSLAATGALCLVGAVGPIIGNMAIQRIGVVGYGVLLPISCLILAFVFRENNQRNHVEESGSEAV